MNKLFWSLVKQSNGDDKALQMIILNNHKNVIDKLENEFLKVKDVLYNKCRSESDEEIGDACEDDGGLYMMCWIISRGEEFYNDVLENPKNVLSYYDFNYENFMYAFNAEFMEEEKSKISH